MQELIIAISKGKKFHELVRFRLQNEQTVYYSRLFPALNLPNIHTTWHDKTTSYENSVIHIKGSHKKNPYLRKIVDVSSDTVFAYPFWMIDLTRINWTKVKEVKSKKVEVAIIPDPFPAYITAYFFQGNKILLPNVIERFINSKDAISFFPFYDGIYSGPAGHPMKCFTFTYEFNSKTSIGGVMLGAQPPVSGYNPKRVKSINKGSLAAFAPGKEKVIIY